MEKILLKNAKLVLEDKLINGSILISENRIEKIFIDNANLSEFTFDEVIDLEGKYLGPAFIDVHTHGADGADAMDGSEEALKKNFQVSSSRRNCKFFSYYFNKFKRNFKRCFESRC